MAAASSAPVGGGANGLKAFARKNAVSITGVAALALVPVFVVTGWLLVRSPPPQPPEADAKTVVAPVDAVPAQARKPDIFDEIEKDFPATKPPEEPQPLSVPASPPPKKLNGPLSPADVYAAAEKSVVVIHSICSEDGSLDGQGSGFFLDPGDVIITNAHVVQGAYALEIKTRDGKTVRITTALALDAARDVAVLPVPPELRGNPGLKIASALPRVGEQVFALGAPKGLEYTFTSGMVSQIRQTVNGRYTLIQTDASISPGSSGGPLLNSSVEVVGITTLGSRAIADANNLNFAVAASELLDACKSRRELASAIRLAADLAQAYYNRGERKYMSGDLEGAIEDCNKAIAIDPKCALTYQLRGTAKYGKSDFDGAIGDCNRAIAIDPKCSHAYRLRGSAKCRKGDFDGAIDDHSLAIAIAPEDALAYSQRGAAKYYKGDCDGAISDHSMAIAINSKSAAVDPRYADAYCGRGDAKCGKGDFGGAIDDFDRAIAINPKHAFAYYLRSTAKKLKGDIQGAQRDAVMAHELGYIEPK